MAFSLALSRRNRADSQSPCRHAVRRAAQVLLIAGALVGAGGPALAATHSVPAPHPAQAQTQAQAPAQAKPADQAQLTDVVTPALPGGICQVPGIGDIGGLVGLCSS